MGDIAELYDWGDVDQWEFDTDRPVHCGYCNLPADFVDSAEVYNGRSYGMIYLCRPCDAWVGCHKGTDKPQGRLANKELRQAKMAAHQAFDPLWKQGEMKRGQAYAWLAQQLGIPKRKAHIGMFDVAQCQRVVEICIAREFDDET